MLINETAPVTFNSATVASTATGGAVTKAKAYNALEALVADKIKWEKGAYKTSNDMLYGILQRCYVFYIQMCAGTEEAKASRDGLAEFIKKKNYKFSGSAHNMTKIVKCVFGADRRRVSAYSIALRRAHADNVSAINLAKFISDNGGVEELRLARSTSMTPKQKASEARLMIANQNLGKVTKLSTQVQLDASKINEQFVLVVTQGANAVITVNAVVHSTAVIEAALASCYKDAKEVQKAKSNEAAARGGQDAVDSAVEAVIQKQAA